MSPADRGNPSNISDLSTSASPSGGPPAVTPARKPYTASAFQIHVWGATGISYTFQYNLFDLVGLIFNLGFGMDPRIVGWALFFPRLIDAFVDPLVGHLSDITKTRWGRRRPFMFVCSILAAFLGIALWQAGTDWHWFAQTAYLCIFVTLYFTVVMTFELSRDALSYELSDDYNIRSKIMAINSFWMTLPQLASAGTYWAVQQLAKGSSWEAGVPSFTLGWLGIAIWVAAALSLASLVMFGMFRRRSDKARWIGGAVTLAAILGLPLAAVLAMHGSRAFYHGGTLEFLGLTFFTVHFPNLGSEVNGIRYVSMVIAVVIIVFAVVPTCFIKERFQNYNQKHVGLWKAFRATLRNKAFLVLIFLRLAETLGTVLYGVLSGYIIIYFVCAGDKSLFSSVLGIANAYIGFAFTILIWPLAAPLTKLIGKRWGLILGFGMTLLSAILAPLITQPGWIWWILAANLFFMPWSMMRGVFFASIRPDICDIDELESGERREGLYTAVYSFINKLEISVTRLASGYLLYWAGFDTAKAAKNIMPSQQVIDTLRWWGFTPLIFFAAVAFVITFFNPLTPKTMEKVHQELEKRRAQTHVVEPDKA